MTGRLLSGAVAGTAPLDELFILGLDRDSRLWLRATPRRIPTRSFQLINADLLTNLHEIAFFKFRAGLFVDAGRAGRWLVDAGIQFHVIALGSFSVNVSFGKNLRTGESVWFTMPTDGRPRRNRDQS